MTVGILSNEKLFQLYIINNNNHSFHLFYLGLNLYYHNLIFDNKLPD